MGWSSELAVYLLCGLGWLHLAETPAFPSPVAWGGEQCLQLTRLPQVLGPRDHGEHSPRPGPPGCSVVTSLAAVTASEATAAKFNICLF